MTERPYTPEQAAERLAEHLGDLDAEAKMTLRLIAVIPPEHLDWRPHPKGRTARDLAWHMATSRVWFGRGVLDHRFGEEGEAPPAPEDVRGLVAGFESAWAEVRGKIEALSPTHLAQPVSFLGFADEACVTYLRWCADHEIHHRGQLSAYLRAMGAKVPGVYGGSADSE